jgi:hypothetical protein
MLRRLSTHLVLLYHRCTLSTLACAETMSSSLAESTMRAVIAPAIPLGTMVMVMGKRFVVIEQPSHSLST